MDTKLILAIITITLALVFYTIGAVSYTHLIWERAASQLHL